jgi:NAD(P)-dependent dehydrogenase (short-subunit alcohol dehydrogenase family)
MGSDQENEGRVVAVTGGASGIGLEFARAWVATGGHTVLLDRSEADLDHAIEELDGSGRGVVVDVTARDQLDEAFASIAVYEKRLNALVTCAGMAQIVETAEIEDDQWYVVQDVHLHGTLRACRAAHPLLAEAEGASIVTVSSIAARLGIPGRAAYTAAKAGIEGLTRTLAAEWAPQDIRVNSVAPGYVRTSMVDRHVRSGELDVTGILARTPLGRLAEPRELASAILFLAGAGASYVTGHTLVVDGGMTTSANW